MSTFRQDANDAGIFLSRQLEQLLPRLYEKKYPDLWAERGAFFPASANLEEGAESVAAEMVNTVGEAAILAPSSDDLPIVEVGIDEDKYKAFCVVCGFRYSVPELSKAAKTGKDIRTMRMMASDRAMKERVHKIAVFGSGDHGATGYFNDPNVTVDDSAYTPATATAQDHINFIADNINAVENSSNLTEGVATILCPAKLHNIWAKTLIPNTSNTVLKHVMETFGDPATGGVLRQIIKINEARSDQLESFGVHAPGTNKDRVLFGSADEMASERLFYPAIYLEPQLNHLNWDTFGYCGTSEPIFHYPGGFRYVDYAKL